MVVFLLAVATVFQYLMGVSGVPVLLGEVLKPLEIAHWLFLVGVALITMVFGMVLEGLPAAVVLIPVVFPIATRSASTPSISTSCRPPRSASACSCRRWAWAC